MKKVVLVSAITIIATLGIFSFVKDAYAGPGTPVPAYCRYDTFEECCIGGGHGGTYCYGFTICGVNSAGVCAN